jgi:hypothetical protein
MVLMLILKDYLNGYCIHHCLTSRKISEKGRKMHVEGIRLLKQLLKEKVKIIEL